MKRQHIVAGNWKMNLTIEEGKNLASAVINQLQPSDTQAILCPPFIHLHELATLIAGVKKLSVGAQNCHFEKSGAYTGEVSASMVKSTGAEYVIIGHSERREYFKESDEMLAKKVDAALSQELKPIFCCGEKLESREAGKQEAVVRKQLKNGLFHLSAEAFARVVIAYEPVWAIGTGRTASKEQAQEMHHFIRKLVAGKYGKRVANATTILYGGSCNAGNAADLFAQPDVDGGLIGGASLKAGDFVTIVNSFPKEKK
jgi:triosephosphate isomerase